VVQIREWRAARIMSNFLRPGSALHYKVGDFFSMEENLSETAVFDFLLPEKSLGQAWKDNLNLAEIWSSTYYEANTVEDDSWLWAGIQATYASWDEFSLLGY
jgi:hypothetical protein